MKVKHILTNPYAENCYVISDDNGTGVIIDPGSDAENISLQLKQIGVKPVAILLTHGHFDHVGAVNYLKNEYNLQVYANIYEKGILSDASKIYVFGGEGEAVKVDKWVSDGDEICFGELKFKVLYTPGHTPGSCCYLIEDLLFAGDTIFYESIGRCDLPGGSFETIDKSIRLKIYTLDDNVTIYPGHGMATDVCHEKNFNPFVTGE